MLRNQLNSKKLNELDTDTFYDTMIDVYTEITMLTGAKLHTGAKLKAQVQILNMFIQSSYRFMMLTVNEVRHAFFLNNQGAYKDTYRHYNRELNAEFVGDVLSAYIQQIRKPLDAQHEKVKALLTPPTQKKLYRPSTRTIQDILQVHYDLFKQEMYELIFISNVEYYYLRKIGAIQFVDKKEWLHRYNAGLKRLRMLAEMMPANNMHARKERAKKVQLYDTMQRTGIVPYDKHVSVVRSMQFVSCMRVFATLQYFNINNIFDEIKTN